MMLEQAQIRTSVNSRDIDSKLSYVEEVWIGCVSGKLFVLDREMSARIDPEDLQPGLDQAMVRS